MSDEYDHAGLKELAKELERPLYTLEVLRSDPFTAAAPAREAGAEWFARLWKKRASLGVQPGQKLHLHGFHYILVSQAKPVRMPDDSDYKNTTECEAVLIRCALDARYLELVSADDFNDRRSVEPTINDTAEAEDPWIGIIGGLGEIKYEPPAFEIPKLEVSPPTLVPHDHLEVWIEKSTQNEILEPLCEQHGIDFQPGIGEFSLTRCLQLVKRAEAHHPRTTRVGYVSDFDPAGQSMPVAVARKVQHLLHVMGLDLDIRLEPIALTHDQCEELELPRTPLKASELRAANFEARYGEGATELDALEALHPGKLQELIQEWIDSYREADLQDRIHEVESDAEDEIYPINDEVHEAHAADIAVVEAAKEACNAAILAEIEKFENIAKPILKKIEEDLDDKAPDAGDFDWPEPDEYLGDDDPLFDSTRDFIEQTDRFKEHQGKPTEGRDRSAERTGSIQIKICKQCGDPFEARRSDTEICSGKCRSAYQRRRNKGEAPASERRSIPCTCEFCGDDFLSATPRARCCGKPECVTKLKADNARARREKRAAERS